MNKNISNIKRNFIRREDHVPEEYRKMTDCFVYDRERKYGENTQKKIPVSPAFKEKSSVYSRQEEQKNTYAKRDPDRTVTS